MNYDKNLRRLYGNFSELGCEYCGGSALSLGKESICHVCEAHVRTTKEELEGKYPSLYEKLASIQDSFRKGLFNEAEKETASLVEKHGDLGVLYAAANLYKFFSDYKYYDLDYNRSGFMEENSENIYTSLDLVSTSKKLFYISLKLVIEQTESSFDEGLLYLQFIINIKLKRLVYAERVMKVIRELNKDDLITQYTNMVYSVESRSKRAPGYLNPLLSGGDVNSYYYLAKYLVYNRKVAEAKPILERILSICHMPPALYLLHNVNKLLEETRL